MPKRPTVRESRFLRATSRIRATLAEPVRQLQLSAVFLLILVLVGTSGYIILERMTPLDALYMTVITLTTVGFSEVAPLDAAGKIFTIFLLLIGVAAAAWAVSNLIEMVVGRAFWLSVQRRRMRHMVSTLRGHYIVCGYGRLGRQIVRDLRARGEPFIIIEMNADLEHELLETQLPHLIRDATQEEALLEAGIERARGLVAALDSDANNVLTVLTARELKSGLLIVSRANVEAVESKLRRAGADRVITPESIGGHRLALALLRPAVDDFFGRVFTLGVEPDVDVGQIMVPGDSPFAGQTLADCDLRRMRNVSILAIRAPSGEFDLTPAPQRVIAAGETLIVIGPAEAIYELEAMYSTEGE